MTIDWSHELSEQTDFHWRHQLRPRLEGLTDEEYFWEPVSNSWSLRPRGEAATALAAGGGDLVLDFDHPQPTPAPVTTIAWRLSHIIVAVLKLRVANHFGGPPVSYETFEYAASADAALRQLDDGYAAWLGGVRALSDDDLARPCGPSEGQFADFSMATLVLHINRELLHHGAEVALLRDLYANRGDR
jgi:hypothetical protein